MCRRVLFGERMWVLHFALPGMTSMCSGISSPLLAFIMHSYSPGTYQSVMEQGFFMEQGILQKCVDEILVRNRILVEETKPQCRRTGLRHDLILHMMMKQLRIVSLSVSRHITFTRSHTTSTTTLVSTIDSCHVIPLRETAAALPE